METHNVAKAESDRHEICNTINEYTICMFRPVDFSMSNSGVDVKSVTVSCSNETIEVDACQVQHDYQFK